MLNIIVDGIKYNYIGAIKLDDKNYVLYTDNHHLDISSYTYVDGKIKLDNIDDETYTRVLKEYRNEAH